MEMLQVVRIELKQDSKGHPYKRVEFKHVTLLPNGNLLKHADAKIRNLFPDAERTLSDGTKKLIKGDSDFHTIAVGDLFGGRIVKVSTTPYLLEGRTISSWSGVVFDTENELTVAAKNLQDNNAYPLTEDGQPFIPQAVVAPTPAAAPTPVAAAPQLTPENQPTAAAPVTEP